MSMLSTQHLSALPTIADMRQTCKIIAVLDAILSPEWEYRYYSYNAQWDEDHQEEVASMRNGEGDEYMILFDANGAIINGFAHESEMNGWQENGKQNIWKGVIDDVPQEFQNFIQTEPIPSLGTTFCIWRKHTDNAWQIGKIDFPVDDYRDGSEMLSILDGKPATYHAFAEEYYELSLKLEWIEYVYSQNTITKEFVLKLNPDFTDWELLKDDLEEIDFPHFMD